MVQGFGQNLGKYVTYIFSIFLMSELLLFAHPKQFTGTFKKVKAPTRFNITNVVSTLNGNVYAYGGNILRKDSEEFNFLKAPVPSVNPSKYYVSPNGNVFYIVNDQNNDGWLYILNGEKWELIEHPLANGITGMYIDREDNFYLGSYGELYIYYSETKNWKRIINFPSLEPVVGIANVGDTLYVLLSTGTLYSIVNNVWLQMSSEKVLQLAGNEKNFVARTSKGFYNSSSQFNPYPPEFIKGVVASISVDNVGQIWFGCQSGEIWSYTGGKYTHYHTGIVSPITGVSTIDGNEVYAVNADGYILNLNSEIHESNSNPISGFDFLTLYPYAREVSDEYGVAIEDFTGDGFPDILAMCIFNPNRFYINRISEKEKEQSNANRISFSEEAVPRKVNGIFDEQVTGDPPPIHLGVGVSDIDNDGDQDIYMCSLSGNNKLFLNNGDGIFRKAAPGEERAVVGEELRSNGAVFADTDLDGDLDLFITNENTSNQLFENDGYGYFKDITEEAGLTTPYGGMSATFGDINGDCKPDLIVASWLYPNLLYINVTTKGGRTKFHRRINSQIDLPEEKSNAVVLFDFDNDADLDLFITNRKTHNRFFVNDGYGNFIDKTFELFPNLVVMNSYGVVVGDFDNDGFQELYLNNVGENVLYKNIGGKQFTDVTIAFNVSMKGYSTGSAVGDVDNDGDLDIYVANYIGTSSGLFMNNKNDSGSVTIKPVGVQSNRDAIGTKVFFYEEGEIGNANALLGYREITSGSGYNSRNQLIAHFGMGGRQKVDVVVEFPTGEKVNFKGVRAGEKIVAYEETPVFTAYYRTKTSFFRHFIDKEFRNVILQFLFGLFMYGISVRHVSRNYNRKQWYATIIILPAFALFIGIILFFRYDPLSLSLFLPFGTFSTFLIVFQLLEERRFLRIKSAQERQLTRDSIAMDLHDDLSSSLSSSLIYLEGLKRNLNLNEPEQQFLFSRIYNLIMESTDAITDLVWTISPKHDSIEDLVSRLRIFIMELCRANTIEHKAITPNAEDLSVRISGELRRNVYLVFKEAVNNAIKHSSASTIEFRVEKIGTRYLFSLSDNGVGLVEFSSNNQRGGNGLGNMKKRAESIGAELTVSSEPNSGTTIQLSLEMT